MVTLVGRPTRSYFLQQITHDDSHDACLSGGFDHALIVHSLYTVFYKRHPFCFFCNSVEWRSICMKFLPDIAKEIRIQNISTKSGR